MHINSGRKCGLIVCHNAGETEEVFALYLIIDTVLCYDQDLHNIAGEILRDHFFCNNFSECKRLEMLLNYLFYSRSSTGLSFRKILDFTCHIS